MSPNLSAPALARTSGIEYLDKIPAHSAAIPPGRIVVHNHVVPPVRRLGVRGFRAWLAPLNDAGAVRRVEPCDCGWAPELGPHYRMMHRGAKR